jgi:hypothetical protein
VIQSLSYAGVTVLSRAFVTPPPGGIGAALGDYTRLVANQGASTQAVPVTTQHVRLCSTSDCYVLFGKAPLTVTNTTGMLLPGLTPEYFWVLPGEQVAVVQATAAGVLNVVECTP